MTETLLEVLSKDAVRKLKYDHIILIYDENGEKKNKNINDFLYDDVSAWSALHILVSYWFIDAKLGTAFIELKDC